MIGWLAIPVGIALLYVWLWAFLNGMNHLHYPGEGFYYDFWLRQYVIDNTTGEREYL